MNVKILLQTQDPIIHSFSLPQLDLTGDLPIVQSFFRGFQGDSDKIQIHTDGRTRKVYLFIFKLFCTFWKI